MLIVLILREGVSIYDGGDGTTKVKVTNLCSIVNRQMKGQNGGHREQDDAFS